MNILEWNWDGNKIETEPVYIDPDDVYGFDERALGFLYNEKFGLIAVPGGVHETLLYRYQPKWLKAAIDRFPDDEDGARAWLEEHILMGRAGYYPDLLGGAGEIYVVSFWNTEPELYDWFGACLKELEKQFPKDLPIDEEITIHTPFGINDYERGAETKKPDATQLSPEQRRKLELRKKLHLMRGKEKIAARKELGLWSDKKIQHPWQKEMEKTGDVSPGQKWWAPHSESMGPQEISTLINEANDSILDLKDDPADLDDNDEANDSILDLKDDPADDEISALELSSRSHPGGPNGLIVDLPHDEDSREEDPDYKDPDFFYTEPSARTFIYTIDNELYHESGTETHRSLEDKHTNDLLGDYKREAEAQTDNDYWESRQMILEHYALYGRVGRLVGNSATRVIVTFWNTYDDIYSLLDGCLKALEKQRIIRPGEVVEIHTPYDISSYDVGTGETYRQQKTSAEQRKRTKLLQRLHLMGGLEKKAARKKLGLWSDKPTKHPWQSGMEKAGKITPGQKWWAPQSEQIEGIARCIEEDI